MDIMKDQIGDNDLRPIMHYSTNKVKIRRDGDRNWQGKWFDLSTDEGHRLLLEFSQGSKKRKRIRRYAIAIAIIIVVALGSIMWLIIN